MGILKEIFSPAMLIVYFVCTFIGGLIGFALGNPFLGGVIGLATPLVFVLGMVAMGYVFFDMLIRLVTGGRR
jgi:hypothetical protein